MSVLAISILSGVTQLWGYLIYAKYTIFGKIRPNAASWSIWAFGAVLESLSYIYLTGDVFKNILPIVCAISAVLFFIVCIVKGYFSRPSNFEISIVVLDIIIIIIWFITKSPFYANILLVITAVISFLPLIVNVYKNPKYEDSFPWFIWTLAYGLQIIVVFFRFEKAEDLIYPVVFFILHIIVAFLAIDYRKRKNLKNLPDMSHNAHPEHL